MASDSYGPGRESLPRAGGAHEPRRHTPAELARRLARTLPEADLRSVVDELNAEQSRLRAERYQAALARGRAAEERGELDAARGEAQEALRIDFVRWEGHRLLGEILERAGDGSSALRCYVTAVHLGWESEEASEAVRRLESSLRTRGASGVSPPAAPGRSSGLA